MQPCAQGENSNLCGPGIVALPTADLNEGGIRFIHWRLDTKDLEVESIDTEDGQSLYPEPAPGFWSYLLPVFLPVLGFFVPWGLVSAVVWVGAGFVDKQKP